MADFFTLQIKRGDQEGGWGVTLEMGNSLDPTSWQLTKYAGPGELGAVVADCVSALGDWTALGALGAINHLAEGWR